MLQHSRPRIPGSSPLHRCFYAIRFGAATTSYLASLIQELKRHHADVRWVAERNIHLTLRFLGELTGEQLAHARSISPSGLQGSPLSLCARGLGAFPLLRAPRVFWAGVDGKSREDTDHLLHIQGRTEQWARQIGLPPEHRRYAPHITLGRVARASEGLRELTDDIIGRECWSEYSDIDEIVLMRSRLSSGGSSYEVLERWELGGN